jgi:hypothetical protein
MEPAMFYLTKPAGFGSGVVNLTASGGAYFPLTVNTGAAVQVSYDVGFEIKVEATDLILSSRNSNTGELIFLKSDGSFEIRSSGQTFTTAVAGGFTSDFKVVRLEYRETTGAGPGGYDRIITAFIDNVQIATYNFGASRPALREFNQLFGLGSGTRRGSVKYYSYTDNLTSTNSRYFDANASNGTGSILPETTGNGVDGTLVNMPTDGSQWVSFAAPGPSEAYVLTAHGVPQANSVMEGNQFATTGPVYFDITGGDTNIANPDWPSINAAQLWLTDINDIPAFNPLVVGSVTYTVTYRVSEGGATGTFQRTVNVAASAVIAANDNWRFFVAATTAPKTWEWGKRHPTTNARVRMFKEGGL